METEIIQDIPKLYTALAEWLACLVFVCLLRPRYSRGATIGIMSAGLLVLAVLQHYIGIGPLYLWMPGMFLALGIMYGIILLCCQVHPLTAAYFWAVAFMFAEFGASLEWQLYFFVMQIGWTSYLLRIIFLVVFYGGTFGTFFYLERKRLLEQPDPHFTAREVISAATIAIGSFLISNISYLDTETPLSGNMANEIFYIRTLVDFAGVLMLIAQQDRIQDAQIKQEFGAVQALLQRQFEQYRQSKESIDLIHRKYHDLKHQIAIIRMEPDHEKREEYLEKMESGMQYYEAEIKTGNHILDTILTTKQLYCIQHGISLNVVADGKQLGFLDIMDLCSIFGNALENAIESVEKIQQSSKRLIKVAVYAQNNFLMIRIGNYYEVAPQMEGGDYRTTKSDHEYHGFGIKSIRYAAESYGGSVAIDTADSWFSLKVLLPIPSDYEPTELDGTSDTTPAPY